MKPSQTVSLEHKSSLESGPNHPENGPNRPQSNPFNPIFTPIPSHTRAPRLAARPPSSVLRPPSSVLRPRSSVRVALFLIAALSMPSLANADVVAPLASTGPLVMGHITLNSPRVAQYGKLEATFSLGGTWNNPFDPHQVAVDTVFHTPSGKVIRLPGFFYQGYERSLNGKREVLATVGAPVWKVRFAPPEPGEYRWEITVKNQGKVIHRQGPAFEAVSVNAPGFVRRAPQPGYFETDNGKTWFGIGENVCWSGAGGTYDYDRWYRQLWLHGANYSRLWTEPFDSFTLEQYDPGRPDAGIGKYKQDDAWRLDYVTNLAERYGIRQMFTLDSYNVLRHVGASPDWNQNAYAKEHGGPITEPSQYFTDPVARKYYERRLRYVIARWSYSTSILCWEFWNEVNGTDQYDPVKVADWHRVMGDYLAKHDPYHHLRTTSVWIPEGQPQIDSLPELDFIQTHAYGQPDYAVYIPMMQKQKQHYDKPHWFGEFGVGYANENGTGLPPAESDPFGISVHNGAWASLMAGCAGTAMTWYWDDYVDPDYLYPIYHPISEFVANLPLGETPSRPLQIHSWTFASPGASAGPISVRFTGAAVSWSPAPTNQPHTFTISREGVLDHPELLSGILHGFKNHPDLHNPETFEVDYPTAGEFGVEVTGVSGYGGAGLTVDLDGRAVIDQPFPDTNPSGSHKTLTQYNRLYSVPVPAGRHQIVVADNGADWVMVSYSAKSSFTRTGPNLSVTGREFPSGAIIWLRSPSYNWLDHLHGIRPERQPPGKLEIAGLADGRYLVDWMNTHTGVWTVGTPVLSEHGLLSIVTPSVTTDVAARVSKEERERS